MTVPALEMVSTCTSAVRPTPAGNAAPNSTRHTSHASKATVRLVIETGLSFGPTSSGTRLAASLSTAASVTRSWRVTVSGAPPDPP